MTKEKPMIESGSIAPVSTACGRNLLPTLQDYFPGNFSGLGVLGIDLVIVLFPHLFCFTITTIS
jgi:hypothetical protein